jgi:glycopeptide antibiotics resistance protein
MWRKFSGGTSGPRRGLVLGVVTGLTFEVMEVSRVHTLDIDDVILNPFSV